jgi:hypothetical protein
MSTRQPTWTARCVCGWATVHPQYKVVRAHAAAHAKAHALPASHPLYTRHAVTFIRPDGRAA